MRRPQYARIFGTNWNRKALAAELEREGIDVCSEAERAVLDAMACIELGVLEAIQSGYSCAPMIYHPACKAELARRIGTKRRKRKAGE